MRSDLFNCVFSGQGRIGLTCGGDPVVIPVSQHVEVRCGTAPRKGRGELRDQPRTARSRLTARAAER